MINNAITILNNAGASFCRHALAMLVQSSALIVVLLLIDFLLRKHVKAVFRYCLWMLVFIKMVLPPTLCLPTGVGYWCTDHLSADWPLSAEVWGTSISGFNEKVVLQDSGTFPQPRQVTPAQTASESTGSVAAGALTFAPVRWQAVVFLLWLIGVLLLSLLLIQRLWFVRSLIRQSGFAKGRLVDALNKSRSDIGIRKRIELKISCNSQSPAACGLFKPKILLPASLLAELSRPKLRVVLIHELAHIKRGDLWVNLAQTVLQIVYFYNPLLWLANAVVRQVREQAVDETVLASLGTKGKEYSNTLIDVAEITFSRPSLGLRLIGVVESKKALIHRINHIVSRPFPPSAKLGVAGWLAIIVAGATLLPMARAAKENVQSDQLSKNIHIRETLEPNLEKVFDIVRGFVTDKSERACCDVYIAPSLTELSDAVRTDEQGQFTLKDTGSSLKTWLAYSRPSRAVGIFTVPEDYAGQPVQVVLNFHEAHVAGRIVNQHGKGIAERKVEFIIETKEGLTHYLETGCVTDRHGNYHARIPCGSGLSVRARLADASKIEQRYVSRAVALSDSQVLVQMPTLVIWPGTHQKFRRQTAP